MERAAIPEGPRYTNFMAHTYRLHEEQIDTLNRIEAELFAMEFLSRNGSRTIRSSERWLMFWRGLILMSPGLIAKQNSNAGFLKNAA